MGERIAFTLDGRAVGARPGETLFEVAAREGVALPHLCHGDGLRPDGNCRACVVEVKGERVLAPMGSSRSKTILVRAPRQARPMTSLTCTSRQARTHRPHWMQASRLTRIAG